MTDPLSLAGSWALVYTVVTTVQAGFIQGYRSTTTTSALVELNAEGEATHRVCDIDMDGGMVKVRVPGTWAARAEPKVWQAHVTPSLGGGWAFEADLGTTPNGFDPERGPLPTAIDSASVADTDGDGKPGATLHVKPPLLPEGEVYVASLTHPYLSGRAMGDGSIAGTVELLASAQHVLGASRSLYATRPEATQVLAESRFRMVRLPEGARCDDVTVSAVASFDF